MPRKNKRLDARLLCSYFKKCFVAVDGLWFTMVEDEQCFDKALETDRKVWEVLPKIQARTVKGLLRLEEGEAAMVAALRFKLEAEDFEHQMETGDGQVRITIKSCPWLARLVKAGRGQTADIIGETICALEYGVFAREFVQPVRVDVACRKCAGATQCRFVLWGWQPKSPNPAV